MGGTFEQTGIITKDPYAWMVENELEEDDGVYPSFENPLEVVFHSLNKMQFPAKKKIKHPTEPTARAAWKPGIDPESRLVPETMVPGILEGNPAQRVDQPTTSGKPTEGEATFVNFICDCSGSMTTEDMGVLPGYALCSRTKMVKIIVSSLIDTCRLQDHHFQIVGYSQSAWDVWPGPSTEYDAAIDFLLAPRRGDNELDPLGASGGTHAGQGMEFALKRMEEFVVSGKWKVKSCYTFVINDDDIQVGRRSDGKSQNEVGYWDEKFRKYGPVFYCFTTPVGPDGNVTPYGEATFGEKIRKVRDQLAEWYGGKYETEDCSTSFGLFWDPILNVTYGAGKFVEICSGKGDYKCTGDTSK